MKKITGLLLFCLFAGPQFSIAQEYVLVLNKSDHTAWQLDAKTGEKIAEYPTNTGPHEVAISPDRTRAAITNYGGQNAGSSITIIDLEKRVVEKVIDIIPWQRPHGIQWFSDGKRLIVSVEARQAVAIVDVEKEEVVKTIKTDQDGSHMVVLSPDEQRVYVPNIGSGTLSVLNIPEGAVIKTIKTGAGTEGITLANNGREVWTSNRSANTISVIDTETLEVLEILESSSFPIRAESSPNGDWVAVSNARSGQVVIFDAQSKERIAEISTETGGANNPAPIGLIFSSHSDRLYVANSEADQVVVIDTGNWKIVNTFKTGGTPDGIAYFIINE